MTEITADRVQLLKDAYALEAHPEGGFFVESYTAPYAGPEDRPLTGSIFYLLEGADVSHFHCIDCDEIWYFHEGCGMRLTLIDPQGRLARLDLGADPACGQRAMVVIPAGVVFAAENLDRTSFSFVSCMTTPKFHYEGFSLTGLSRIRALCPEHADELAYLAYPDHLTREHP